MQPFDDAEFKALLTCYTIPEPPEDLIARTTLRMSEELTHPVAAQACREVWVFVLTGLAVVMSLCLFYMFTVGTILQFVVPAWMALYLRQSLLVFTAVGTSVIAGAFMTLLLKYYFGSADNDRPGCYHLAAERLINGQQY